MTESRQAIAVTLLRAVRD